MQGRRRRGAEAAARGRWRGGLPAASAHPSDRLGFLWWGKRTANLREHAPGPHPLLLCVLRDRGPPAFHGLGAPDQGASQRTSWPLGQLAEINLTFSPLISPCLLTYLNLYFLHSLFFVYLLHHGLVHMSMPHRHGQ